MDVLFPIAIVLFVSFLALLLCKTLGADRKLIAARRQRIRDLRETERKLSSTVASLEHEITEAKSQIREHQSTARMLKRQADEMRESTAAEEKMRSNQHLKLVAQLAELGELADAKLISESQFAETLCEFIEVYMEPMDIKKSLEAVQSLKTRGLLDDTGYKRISDLMLERQYSRDLGVRSNLVSAFKKLRGF